MQLSFMRMLMASLVISKPKLTTPTQSLDGVDMTFTLDDDTDTLYIKSSGTTVHTVTRLATPTGLSITGTTLSWTAVSNATSYKVFLDGDLFDTVETNSCDLSDITDAGEYELTVQALAGGYLSSPMSEAEEYEVVAPSGETWLLNETVSMEYGGQTNYYEEIVSVSFISNEVEFTRIKFCSYNSNDPYDIDYWGCVLYEYPNPLNPSLYISKEVYGGDELTAYFHTSLSTEYRKLTFSTTPTGDLLAWLQANGVKQ